MTGKEKPNSVDIQRLKEAVKEKKAFYEDMERKLNEQRTNEMKANVCLVKEKEIQEGRDIGVGNFGTVTQGRYQKRAVAIKRLKKNVVTNPIGENKTTSRKDKDDGMTPKELNKKEEALKHEAYMMYRCADTSVVRLIGQGDFNSSKRFFFVMELVNGLSLEEEYKLATKQGGENSIFHENHFENLRLRREEGIEDPVFYQIVRIGRDVALALKKIHERGIIHLDIAARNILLDHVNGKVKIADFGLAQDEKEMIEDSRLRAEVFQNMSTNHMDKSEAEFFFQWSQTKQREKNGKKEEAHKQEAFTTNIPRRWRPIWNLREGSWIDRTCDIYAYGCCLYEILAKQPPFHDVPDDELMKAKESIDSHPRLPDNLHPIFAGVIKRCWGTRGSQPEMKDVHFELAQLHKTICRGEILSQQNQETYEELKEFLGAKREKSPYMRATAFGERAQYSSTGNEYSSLGINASNTNYSKPISSHSGDLNSKSSGSVASATESPGIDIRSQESTENDGKVQNRNSTVPAFLSPFISIKTHNNSGSLHQDGYTAQNSKQGLLNMLNNAFRYQDCFTIADTLAMVAIGDSDHQLDVIERCLELMNKYVSDSHNAIEIEDNWFYLAQKIASKIRETIEYVEVAVSSTAASRCLTFIQTAFQTLSGILKFKHWNSKRIAKDGYITIDDQSAEKELWCKDIAINCASTLDQFNSDALIVGWCAIALNDVAENSEQIIETLHGEGVVQKLISFGRKFMSNGTVVMKIFTGLNLFSLSQILQPGGSSLPTQKAPISQDLLDQSWSAFRRLAFDVMRVYTQSNSQEDTEVLRHVMHCLWDIVCNGQNDANISDEEEKFFLSLEANDIALIVNIIKLNSDNFEILESAIGVLSVMLETGVALPALSNEVMMDEFSHKLDHSERIQLFMATEENIKSILSAMEKFSVDDQITIGIVKQAASPQQKQYQSKGALFSNHRSSSYSGAFGLNNYRKQSYTSSSSPYSPTLYQRKEGPDKDDGTKSGFVYLSADNSDNCDDEEAQLPVFAADGRKITAGDLQRNAINVISIVSSESKDIQQVLRRTRYNELILRAFKTFKNDPLIIHNGLKALFYASRKNARQQIILHDLSITKHLMAALVRFLDFGSSWRSILVLEGVLGAFLGLLDPEEDRPFNPQEVSRDIATWTEAYSTVNKDSPTQKHCKELAKILCDETVEVIQIISIYVIYLSLSESDASMMVRLLFIRLLSILNFWSPHTTTRWLNLSFLNKKLHIADNKSVEFDFKLYGYLICLLKKEKAPEVIASGLSLLVEIIRASQGTQYDTILLGREVPSISITRDGDKEDGSELLIRLCLTSCRKKLDNVLLIRYSLWMMIFMIIGEEKKDKNNTTFSKVMLEENRDAASEIAVANGIEWAIEVLTNFTDFYSLQSLSLLFLIWMERRGHFAKRLERLEALREILVGIVTSQPPPKYRSLDEEGYDSSLVGRTIYMFGDVPTHADRLLKLVEKHLADATASHTRGAFNSGKATKNSKAPWDGKNRPQALVVKRYESQQNEDSGKTSNVFVIEITWETVLIDPINRVVRPTVWEVRKRFPECVKFQKELMKLFSFYPSLFNKVLNITVLDQVTRFFMVSKYHNNNSNVELQ